MFHWHQIWKQMHKLTKKEIEKRAVMELINYYEPQINAVINQSAKELEKTNKLFEIQGLPKKKRIDQDSVKKAIKTINAKSDAELPEKQVGSDIERKEKNEKHLPKTNFSTEVKYYG